MQKRESLLQCVKQCRGKWVRERGGLSCWLQARLSVQFNCWFDCQSIAKLLLLIHAINDRSGPIRFQTGPRALTLGIDLKTLQTNHAENKQDFCKELNTLSKLPRRPRASIQSRKSCLYYLPPDCCCALKGAAHGEGSVQDFTTNVHNLYAHLQCRSKRMLWIKYNAFWFQMNLTPDCHFPFWHWL